MSKQPDICYSTDCPMYSKLLPNGCGIEWQDEHIPLAARCKDFTDTEFHPCAGCASSSSDECNGLESCTVSQMVKGAA